MKRGILNSLGLTFFLGALMIWFLNDPAMKRSYLQYKIENGGFTYPITPQESLKMRQIDSIFLSKHLLKKGIKQLPPN